MADCSMVVKALRAFLDSKDFHYQVLDDTTLKLGIQCDHTVVREIISFDDDGDSLNIRTTDLATCPKDKRAEMYKTLNDLNYQYRWVCFRVDDRDGEVDGTLDAVVDLETVGSEVYELLFRVANICDDAYKDIMKVVLF